MNRVNSAPICRPTVDSIIFDLDGTLWDASESSALAWGRVCRELGINKSFSGNDIKAVSGLPFDNCVDLLFGGHSEPDLKTRLDQAEKDAILERGGVFYEGLHDGIKRLAENYKLYLVSNCQDWYLEAFMIHSGLKEYFIDSQCYGRTQKPKTDNIRSIISKNILMKSVYVGDTHWDQEAAFYAGTKFIFAAYGFGRVTISCPKVTSFSELVEVFSREPGDLRFEIRKL